MTQRLLLLLLWLLVLLLLLLLLVTPSRIFMHIELTFGVKLVTNVEKLHQK